MVDGALFNRYKYKSMKVFQSIFFWGFSYFRINKNKVVLVEYTNNDFMNFALTILAKIVSIALNIKISILITPDINKIPKFSRFIYRCLGVSSFNFLYQYIKIEGRQILFKFREEKLKINTVEDIYNYTYDGVYIGDLLYDMILRSNGWKATIKEVNNDLDDPLYSIVSTLTYVDFLVKEKNIHYSVFSHPTMLGGVIQRYLLLKYKLKGVTGSIHTSIRKIDELIENRNPYPAEVPIHFIDRIINNDKLKNRYLNEANEFLENKIKGKIYHKDNLHTYSDKSLFYNNKSKFNDDFGLNQNNLNIVMALHVFNDQPNTVNGIYFDYFQWFRNTLLLLSKNQNINIIIKEHPSKVFYPTIDFDLKQYIANEFSDNSSIIILDSDVLFNTYSIKFIADLVITSAGSIALESSMWGVKSLTCSSSYYSHFDITTRAKDIFEYEHYLNNLFLIPDLTEEQIEKSKLVYYFSHGVLWDGTWNNDVFFPKLTFEEKTSPNMDKIINYYINFLRTKECKKYIDQMIHFIKNDKANVFFRDQELAKLEEKD